VPLEALAETVHCYPDAGGGIPADCLAIRRGPEDRGGRQRSEGLGCLTISIRTMAISKFEGKVEIVTRRIKRDWSAAGRRAAAGAAVAVIYSSNKEGKPMKQIINWLDKFWIFESDIDYHLMRASMVIIFLFFGYQKWWNYEAQVLIPYISNRPLISWMYPSSESGVPVISWECRNGSLARFCSLDSGTRNSASLALGRDRFRSC